MMNWNDNRSSSLPRLTMARRRHTTTTTTPPSRLESSQSSSEDEYGYTQPQQYLEPPPPLPPCPDPMSPERRARKQRIRSRRGGACHSDLLKSAVLATLESEDDLHATASSLLGTSSTSSLLDSTGTPMNPRHMVQFEDTNFFGMDDHSRSERNPRKRARQMVQVDESLLGAMDVCTISASTRQPTVDPVMTVEPTRHVARRTSEEMPSPRATNGTEGSSNNTNRMVH